MNDHTKKATAPEGYNPAPSSYFTGTVWIKSLIVPDEATNCTISDVVFEPAARNNWHIHPSNQILIVTKGEGYYQEKGSPIRRIRVGSVVNVLPGIKHWHGASPDSEFAHLAINLNSEKGTVNWLEPVSDEEYFSEAK
jgi:quercetin dioxygenase-like cupin family protein